MVTGRRKSHRVTRPENQISGKKSAEEHDLLRQEKPHPDRDALLLLLHVFELVLKTGRMVMLQCFCVCRHVLVGCMLLALHSQGVFYRQLPRPTCDLCSNYV